jgi:predicted nucleotide-binding protein
MNWVQDLTLHVNALLEAMQSDKEFFAPVMHYVKELKRVLSLPSDHVSKPLFVTPAKKVKEFWDSYRSDKPTPGMVYFPPAQTSNTQSTVDEIYTLITKLTTLPDPEFSACFLPAQAKAPSVGRPKSSSVTNRIFVGHGRSKLWARVKVHIESELQLKTLEFESESRVGQSVVPVLKEMLEQSAFAILILTAEDETKEGSRRARQNVIHEAGLFQGRLGFEKVVLLKQDGVEDLSNLAGLQYIPFSGENVEQTFYELGRVLKREGLI